MLGTPLFGGDEMVLGATLPVKQWALSQDRIRKMFIPSVSKADDNKAHKANL